MPGRLLRGGKVVGEGKESSSSGRLTRDGKPIGSRGELRRAGDQGQEAIAAPETVFSLPDVTLTPDLSAEKSSPLEWGHDTATAIAQGIVRASQGKTAPEKVATLIKAVMESQLRLKDSTSLLGATCPSITIEPIPGLSTSISATIDVKYGRSMNGPFKVEISVEGSGRFSQTISIEPTDVNLGGGMDVFNRSQKRA